MPDARLADLRKSFARHLRAEGKADRTAVLYGMSVVMFGDWLEDQGRPATLEECSTAAIREWLATLADRGNAAETVRTRYRGLHRFLGWCVDEGELEANPMRTLRPPVPKATPVPVFSDAELAALLAACRGKTFEARRDEVIVRLLLDCGLRVSELCSLTMDGLDGQGIEAALDRGMLLVRGKGAKVRPLYPAARTVAALDRYLRVRRSHRLAHLPALVLSQRAGMTPDGVRERLRVIGDRAGVPDCHPHRFRHTFAHDFLANGGQERDLMRLAGWSSDAMLSRYGASAADARAKAAAQRLRRGDRV